MLLHLLTLKFLLSFKVYEKTQKESEELAEARKVLKALDFTKEGFYIEASSVKSGDIRFYAKNLQGDMCKIYIVLKPRVTVSSYLIKCIYRSTNKVRQHDGPLYN